MKKPLFSLICAVSLLFSSCSKENTAAPKDEKLYPVTFNVSTFSKEIVPMASLKKTAGQVSASTTTTGTNLSEAIDKIEYAVYNESGTKVNDKVIRSTEPNFGRIEDSLPKGKYTIMIFGTKESYQSVPQSEIDAYHLNRIDGGNDVLFKLIELEVKGTAIDQNLQLLRKVGKVEIKLIDEIPANIEEIAYSISGTSSYFYPISNSAGQNQISNINYYYDNGDEMGAPDYSQEFGLFFFLAYDHDAIASVNIRAYDRNRNLVVDKTINDVPVAINKKTILTGRLFDDAGSTKGQTFSISVDDKWNSESNHVEF